MNTGQSIAYATIALERLGYSKEEIEKITNKMLEEMHEYSKPTAEIAADKIVYED